MRNSILIVSPNLESIWAKKWICLLVAVMKDKVGQAVGTFTDSLGGASLELVLDSLRFHVLWNLTTQLFKILSCFYSNGNKLLSSVKAGPIYPLRLTNFEIRFKQISNKGNRVGNKCKLSPLGYLNPACYSWSSSPQKWIQSQVNVISRLMWSHFIVPITSDN